MKNLLILLFYFFSICWKHDGKKVNAQQIQLESLQKLLLKNKDGNLKELQLLNAIAQVQVNINPNEALVNADKAIALAQKLNNQKELATAFNNKGFILLRKSEYLNSKDFIKKSLSLNSALKNQIGIADNQTNLAEILRREGETNNAKVLLENAQLIYLKENNKNGLADTYYYLGLVYRDLSDNNQLLFLNEKAIELYKQTKNENGEALSLNSMGGYYYRIGDHKKAIEVGQQALIINLRIGNLYGLSLDYGNISTDYAEMGDFPKAIELLLKSFRINEQMGNLHLLANDYILAGTAYFEMGQYKMALYYLKKGHDLFEQLKINNGQYRMGCNYLGITYFYLNESQKSFANLYKALKVNLSAKDDWALSDCYNHLGEAYLKTKNYDSAFFYFNKGLKIDSIIQNPLGLSLEYLGLAKVFAKASPSAQINIGNNALNRNNLIVEYLQKSISLALESNNKKTLRDSYKELSEFYNSQRQINKAFYFFKKHIEYKDSIENTANTNLISMLQLQYDTEKKEQQIKLLNTDNTIKEKEISEKKTQRNGFIIGCILLLLIGGVAFNRYQVKQKANKQLSAALTQLKEAQQQLIEQEKLASLGQLTAGIAHEIQNPLNFVINFSQLSEGLFEDLNSNDETLKKDTIADLEDNLNIIEKHGKRAEAIIQSMLMHARSKESNIQKVNLNTICKDAIQFSWQAMEHKYPNFICKRELEFDESLPAVNIVEQDIARVIINLLNNALYAVHEKKQSMEMSLNFEPQINIRTLQNDQYVFLNVTDNGNGIPQEIRNKIFQPFFTTKPTNLGTGLGLSISYDIVKTHGGTLSLDNTSEEGTTFEMRLPV